MRSLAKQSASVLFVASVTYAITVVIGMVSYGLHRPIEGMILLVMEVLTIFLALLIVVLMATIHSSATDTWKTNTLIALVFAALLAGVSVTVHFVQLTAIRQLGSAGLVWPSPMYAAELLAWDVFFGLSLLFAAPALRGSERIHHFARVTMGTCGAMCLFGVVGPVTGMMWLQFIAVAGYGLVFPACCLILALAWNAADDA